ncbi:MAG TPA: DUF2079 domain-containing protein [bacterium]|nr:DUF2079 domain-containing protein [bacterium]
MRIQNQKNNYTAIRIQFIILIAFSLVLCFLMSYQTARRYYSINPQSWDISIYIQNMFLISNGLEFNTVRGINIWGHHIEPVLYPIARLIKIYGKPEALLLIQVFTVCFGSILVFYFSGKLLGSAGAGFITSLLYLIYPGVQNSALFEFHPGSLALPFFFPFIYYLKSNKLFPTLFFLFIILSTRENYAIPAFCLSVYYFRRNRTFKIVSIISALYFLAAIFFIKPYFNNGNQDLHLVYYSGFGNGTFQIVLNIFLKFKYTLSLLFSVDSLKYLLALYAPLMFIPLIKFKMNLILIPMLAINLLSNHPGVKTIDFHFQNEIILLIFAVFIESVVEFKNRKNSKFIYSMILVLIISVPVSIQYSRLYLFDKESKQNMKYDHKYLFAANLKQFINQDFNVCADITYCPYFSYRKNIYLFPNCPENTDVIILYKKYLDKENNQYLKGVLKKRGIKNYFEIGESICYFLSRKKALTQTPH